LAHCIDPGAPNAWIDIGLFFSLSGLLMTSMALNVYFKKGTFAVVYFWSRRVLRLLPVRSEAHYSPAFLSGCTLSVFRDTNSRLRASQTKNYDDLVWCSFFLFFFFFFW
jgi:hypothetical protein